MVFAPIFVGCKDDAVSPTPGNGNGNGNGGGSSNVIEEVSWVASNAQFPTQGLRDSYSGMEFRIDADNNYSWKWNKKDGQVLDFEGTVLLNSTDASHTNGEMISMISVDVMTINGQSAPGGWFGIYTFDDDGNLLMNVEPKVNGWEKHPDYEEGIGSGTSGMESVYTFSKE